MPKTTLIFAALLIALGVGAFSISSSRTAMLPAYVGIALAALAGRRWPLRAPAGT